MNEENTERENLGTSLIESVGSPSLIEIASEAVEIALDSVLNESLLKDLPVFGWLFKGYTTYRSVTDRIFLKKIAMFLRGVSEASGNDRERFRTELNENPEFRKRVGESLLLLIDRHERLEKSYLLGKLMAKVVEGKLSNDLFLRLAAGLDRSTVEDLEDLRTHRNDLSSLEDHVQQGLYKSGLLDIHISAYTISEPFVSTSVAYKLNNIGDKLIEFAFADRAGTHDAAT